MYESIKSSVLTVVFMGLMVSKHKQATSPLVEDTHHFWEMVGFIANKLLFFITVQVIAAKVAENASSYGWHDFVILLVLYISCHIIRAIAVLHLFLALEAMGYGCTWQDDVVMVYGCLRCAIGLALIVYTTDLSDDSGIDGIDYDLEKDRVLIPGCGIVFLTLLVNAATVSKIVSYLKLNKPPKRSFENGKQKTKRHPMIDNANSGDLAVHMETINTHQHTNELAKEHSEVPLESTTTDHYDPHHDHHDHRHTKNYSATGQSFAAPVMTEAEKEAISENKKEFDKRVMQIMKSCYLTQCENGLISGDAACVSVEAADQHECS